MSLCMIVAPQNLHWVLDRIAHEIGDRYGNETMYCYDLNNIPDADNYFVTHYTLLPAVLRKSKKVTCFFTHESAPLGQYVPMMNLCHAVVCENIVENDHLIAAGVNPNILHSVVECGDPVKFRPHSRTGKGNVLISSACYPRKNPGLINNVINACPDLKFTIIGKDWPEYITSRANVDYKNNLEYEKYQDEYEKCDVFLSCATLEGGGPGGLIESMLSNIVPVVSDTGNARQYIVDGYNGFIFPTDANSDVVVGKIREAYKANPQDSLPYNDIWQTAQHYTWDFYALQMKEIIDGTTDHSNSATLSN